MLIETSGAHDISPIDPRVHRIMDLKTPGSGEVMRNRMANLELLGPRDEVKFVIGSEEGLRLGARPGARGHARLGRPRERDSVLARLRQNDAARSRHARAGRRAAPRADAAADAQADLGAEPARGLAATSKVDWTYQPIQLLYPIRSG